MPHQAIPTMAFVDHSFHKKTQSADFLRTIFSEHFAVTNLWDSSWKDGESISPAVLNEFDYIFYFQSINAFTDLLQITRPIIWAPMYDNIRDDGFWRRLSSLHIKVLAFSSGVTALCQRFNIPSIKIKYFIKPVPNQLLIPQHGNHFFFWYRGGVKLEAILACVDPSQVDSFTYLSTPDPYKEREIIEPDTLTAYNISVIEADFLPREEYLSLVSKANIFVAPRAREGIGMSFLEALAMGLVMLAYDDHTMNEYIEDQHNGFLFGPNTGKINLTNVKQIRKQSVSNVITGHKQWIDDAKRIVPFVKAGISDRGVIRKIRRLWFQLLT